MFNLFYRSNLIQSKNIRYYNDKKNLLNLSNLIFNNDFNKTNLTNLDIIFNNSFDNNKRINTITTPKSLLKSIIETRSSLLNLIKYSSNEEKKN